MADTGCWVMAELDDEGALRVQLYAAADWDKGEPPVKHGEEVTDQVPADVRAELVRVLSRVLEAGAPSALALAKSAAVRHSNFKYNRLPPRTVRLDFKGGLTAGGEMAQKKVQ
jgi:hypothetical protein